MIRTMKTIGKKQLPANLIGFLALLLLVPVAHATVLNDGSSVFSSPLSPGGTLEASISGTITTPTFTTDYTQWVYADPGNTWCAGCLDFVYQFTNDGPRANERFSMYNFAGVMADVGTNPFGMHDPDSIDRSVSGAVIGFNYTASNEIAPGETTPWLVIETDAMTYTNGFVSVQDGTAGFGNAYAPTATPEPSTLALVGGGFTLLGGALRKRLKNPA